MTYDQFMSFFILILWTWIGVRIWQKIEALGNHKVLLRHQALIAIGFPTGTALCAIYGILHLQAEIISGMIVDAAKQPWKPKDNITSFASRYSSHYPFGGIKRKP